MNINRNSAILPDRRLKTAQYNSYGGYVDDFEDFDF